MIIIVDGVAPQWADEHKVPLLLGEGGRHRLMTAFSLHAMLMNTARHTRPVSVLASMTEVPSEIAIPPPQPQHQHTTTIAKTKELRASPRSPTKRAVLQTTTQQR